MTERRGVLIDTSAWIEAMRVRGDEVVRESVGKALREDRARLCDLVRLELWNGVRGDEERKWLSSLEQTLQVVETGPEVWRLACELAIQSRSHGLTLPSTDLLIAACARHHDLDLLHRDRHFELLAEAVPISS
ncbi:MAG: PIN domain-containing protein [Acidobacteriota bacterium]|nr:PIN domain-containing protein [Acidobacteriota bacterium]